MQSYNEIKSYLNRIYTKAELVNLVTQWYLHDTLPPDLPEDLGPVQRATRPGRPTHEDERQLAVDIDTYLTALGERKLSRAALVRTFGITTARLDKLIHQPAFLKHLTTDNRVKLTSIWFRRSGRLSPVQRAVLDLHNYMLLLAWGPTHRLRLYDMHRLVWSSGELSTSRRVYAAANLLEARRVYHKLMPVIEPLGYPVVQQREYADSPPILNEGPCAVLQAIVHDEDLANVSHARFVLETQVPVVSLGQTTIDYIRADWSWEDAVRAIAGRLV